MQIRISDVGQPKDMGKYSEIVVKYDQDGETKERTIRSFVSQEVYSNLVRAKPGQAFEIKAVKDGKYWNWMNANLLDGEAPTGRTSTTGSPTKATGTWETPEERAKKQVYIIRQSSISNAVALSGTGKDVDYVLGIAKQFEKYVLGIEDDKFKDDIV